MKGLAADVGTESDPQEGLDHIVVKDKRQRAGHVAPYPDDAVVLIFAAGGKQDTEHPVEKDKGAKSIE